MNEIIYNGKIIERKNFKKDYIRLTVLSRNGDNTYVSFLCEPHKIDKIPEGTQRVNIKGHLESHSEKYNGKYVLRQHYYVDEIEASKTILEDKFGIKGKYYEYPSSSVYIKGKVKALTKDGDWDRYTILTDETGESKSYSIVASRRNTGKKKSDISEGDDICCVCMIATPQKIINNKKVHYEDLLISDIAKVN